MTSRLDEFDRVEWWDICRRLKPRLTRKQFAKFWRGFMAEKERREMASSMQ